MCFVFARRVTRSYILIGCYGHQVFVLQINWILNAQHQQYLITNCGDGRRVSCVAFFSKQSSVAQNLLRFSEHST